MARARSGRPFGRISATSSPCSVNTTLLAAWITGRITREVSLRNSVSVALISAKNTHFSGKREAKSARRLDALAISYLPPSHFQTFPLRVSTVGRRGAPSPVFDLRLSFSLSSLGLLVFPQPSHSASLVPWSFRLRSSTTPPHLPAKQPVIVFVGQIP